MKKILLFIFLLSSGLAFSQAQDTIFMKDGSYLTAKVTEIGKQDIKYRKPDNPDGPLYVVSRKEVASIHYPNGNHDIFHSGPRPAQRYEDEDYTYDDRPKRTRHCDVEIEDVLPVIDVAARVLFWSVILCPRIIFR